MSLNHSENQLGNPDEERKGDKTIITLELPTEKVEEFIALVESGIISEIIGLQVLLITAQDESNPQP